MSRRTSALIGVVTMSALLVLYFSFIGLRATALLASGTLVAVLMGVSLLVLPLIGVWALVRELLFGLRSTQLVDVLDAENQLPDDLGEVGPNGKPDRATADAAFERYKLAAEAEAHNWRAWARLGIVYDACGDRRRARASLREAITLHRNEIRGDLV